MRAVLHVPVSRDFDFEKYVMECLSSVAESYQPHSRKNRVKPIKRDDGSVSIQGTRNGELWTWVTAHGNAIRVWETKNIKHHRVVAIEFDSRRHAIRDNDNGVGSLVAGLEHLSGIYRDDWDVIWLESRSKAPWYQFGANKDEDYGTN